MVYGIAAGRHATKRGEGHLSKSAHAVLERWAVAEAEEAMAAASGFVLLAV